MELKELKDMIEPVENWEYEFSGTRQVGKSYMQNLLNNKDKIINDLLKRISDLEFEVERLERVINEQRLENKLTHKELYKVWEERDILYRRIYKAVDNLETPYFRECEQQCKDVIDILKGVDKE